MSTPLAATSPAAGCDAARRVLFVINDLAIGGAQRAMVAQASVLDRMRFEPVVASLELIPEGPMAALLAKARIPVHRLRRPDESPLVLWPRLGRLIAHQRPDIVHTHLAAAGIAGRLAARHHRVPGVVTTVHNVRDWEERRNQPLRWVDRRTLPLADLVVAVSDAVRRAIDGVCPRLAARVVTLRNGVALDDLAAPTPEERRRARTLLGYGPDDFVVGTVARLDHQKGVDTLVEAIAAAAPSCHQLRLLVVGDGPERDHLTALARARGIEAAVRFPGYQLEVKPYLHAMDIYAAPSRTEGLGVAIIEAMASGLPVLGTAVGGIPEIVTDEVSGRLLPPDQPAVWAVLLVHYARHHEELALLATGAAAQARSFAVAGNGVVLERLYASILDGQGA